MTLAARRKMRLVDRQRYEAFVQALGPLLWLALNEQTGSIADNRAYTSAPGSERVSNGSFASDTVWSKGTGWSISGGKAHFSNATATDLTQSGVVGAGDGQTYTLTFTISGLAAGSCGVYLGGVLVKTVSANGIYTARAIHTSGSTALAFQGSAGAVFDLDDVSAKPTGDLDGAIGGTTALGQTGLRGSNEAFLFDGATSIVTIANRASIQGLTDFTLWALLKPSSAGEMNSGTLFSKTSEIELRFNSASRDVQAIVYYGTTNAQGVTTTALSLAAWQTVALRIRAADQTPAVFIDGIEASYASQVPGVGTRASTTNALIVGNNASIARTWHGLYDEALLIGRALTDAEIATLDQVARAG